MPAALFQWTALYDACMQVYRGVFGNDKQIEKRILGVGFDLICTKPGPEETNLTKICQLMTQKLQIIGQ